MTKIEWTDETWNPIPSHPRYEVTIFGKVRNAATKRVLNPMAHHSGHLYFFPHRKERLYVHVAVLETYVGPRPSKDFCCRHLDGHPSNNHVSNLAWGTYLENARDKQRHGTQPRGESAGTAKLTEADVRRIRELAGTMSYRDIGAMFGVSHTAARRAAKGIKWSHLL